MGVEKVLGCNRFIFTFRGTADYMRLQALEQFVLSKLDRELPAALSYHSAGHTRDVLAAASRLAQLEGLNVQQTRELTTAVLLHDTGFLVQQQEHEQVGCVFARQWLPDYGYDQDTIERVCGMIMATRIPQSPKNLSEQIICDADLDYLGRADFFEIGELLFAELKYYGVLTTEEEWNRLQVKFLEGHTYFTASAQALRLAQKMNHLEMVKKKITTL